MTRLVLDLHAQYGTFTLDAALDADLQGVTALFGPSGSGKTTVLGTIAGFRRGLGRVQVDGTDWQDARRHWPAHRRPVGMVFQDGRLFDHLSVAGNLGYAARRATPDGPAVTWDDAVDALDLRQMLDRRPATLSGGERQRVAMARALMTRPRLMLMDEPLAALDRARKASLLPMIAALPQRFGIAVLFVSHHLDEIVQIAPNLIAMRAGRITGHGPTPDMLGSLDPEITGRFEAGSLLTGPVIRRDPTFAMVAIDIGGAPLWLPETGAVDLGTDLRVRVRARDVSLATGPVTGLSIRNQIPGIVTRIETETTAFAEVHLSCGGQALRARVSRMALADLNLAPGQQVMALIKSIAFDRRLSRK